MAEHRESSDVVIETGSGSGLKWFVLGALVGAGVGLLFAPASGERTRRNLAKRARRLRSQAEDKIEEFGDELQERGRQIKERVEDWADEVVEETRDGRRAVERTAAGAREELERRLSSARARRRSAVAADGVADDDESDD